MVREHYAGAKKLLEFEFAKQTGNLSTTNYGDWVAPDSGGGKPPEDPRNAGTAYVHLMTNTVADVAELIGRDEDAEQLRARARPMRSAFNATFYDDQAGYYSRAAPRRRPAAGRRAHRDAPRPRHRRLEMRGGRPRTVTRRLQAAKRTAASARGER